MELEFAGHVAEAISQTEQREQRPPQLFTGIDAEQLLGCIVGG
jgi:hypothetical protein